MSGCLRSSSPSGGGVVNSDETQSLSSFPNGDESLKFKVNDTREDAHEEGVDSDSSNSSASCSSHSKQIVKKKSGHSKANGDEKEDGVQIYPWMKKESQSKLMNLMPSVQASL